METFAQKSDFYARYSHKWLGGDKENEYSDWYLKASFGHWNRLNEGLSKTLRQMLNDKEDMYTCRSMFGNPSDDFLDILINKDVLRVLDETRRLRNDWKGHGGFASDSEYKNRAIILERYLNKLRKLIGGGFADVSLVSPGRALIEDGIFKYDTMVVLRGTKFPFKQVSMDLQVALDSKRLYLIHDSSKEAVRLLPFIKYEKEQGACYFYSKVESGKVKYVSYHFIKDSTKEVELDDDIEAMLEHLTK
jgi:hypothetical protein